MYAYTLFIQYGMSLNNLLQSTIYPAPGDTFKPILQTKKTEMTLCEVTARIKHVLQIMTHLVFKRCTILNQFAAGDCISNATLQTRDVGPMLD